MKLFRILIGALALAIAGPAFAQATLQGAPAGNPLFVVKSNGDYVPAVSCMNPGTLVAESCGASTSGTLTNPTSVLTRPANTTAYAAGNLVGSSTTAGSVTVPSFSIANTAGGSVIPKVLLSTNVTTGWAGIGYQIDFWRAAPTFTNGDGGAYAVATGAANYLGSYTGTFAQAGDGAYSEAAPVLGNVVAPKLASGASIFWTIKITSAATPISGQTFTLTGEVMN